MMWAYCLHIFKIMFSVVTVFISATAVADDAKPGSWKDMLQGYLMGQLSSALGAYQVEALRREFKSFTEVMEKSMKLFKDKIDTDIKAVKDAKNHSIVYTRWGKKICTSKAELVFSGYAGGSDHIHTGAAVEPLCLPRDPQWGIYKDGAEGYKNYVYGAEYQTETVSGYMSKLNHHDVPCAVCLVRNRSVVKMFPARKTCFRGWKSEYQGYLIAGHHGHAAGTQYTCVDSHPDTLQGGQENTNGYLFYMVEARCGSLKCPPYVEGRELTCVVCSKE